MLKASIEKNERKFKQAYMNLLESLWKDERITPDFYKQKSKTIRIGVSLGSYYERNDQSLQRIRDLIYFAKSDFDAKNINNNYDDSSISEEIVSSVKGKKKLPGAWHLKFILPSIFIVGVLILAGIGGYYLWHQSTYRLINDLKSQDYDTSKEAQEELVQKGEPAVGPLIGLLRDSDEKIQIKAKMALSQIGEPAIRPLLAEFESHGDTIAQSAIVGMGKTAVIPLTEELKSQDVRRRADAALVLGMIAEDNNKLDANEENAATDSLESLLNDQYENVQIAAAISLSKYCDTAGVPVLLKAMGEKDLSNDYKMPAFIALNKLGSKATEQLIQGAKDVNTSAAAIGQLLAIGATSALESLLKDPSVDEGTKAFIQITVSATQKVQKPLGTSIDSCPP